jgi:cell division protein FtsI (penicillin-binding protein 3)
VINTNTDKKTWHQPKKKQPSTNHSRRRFIKICFVGLLLLLMARLFALHIMQTKFLRAQGNARTLRQIEIPSYRGVITDRRGSPLAVSTPVDAIWINPQTFNPSTKQMSKLVSLLDLKTEDVLSKQNLYANKSFAYLKRGLPPRIAKEILALKISGLGKRREFRRFYPAGKHTAQLVGFTDIDDKGQSGLELGFNQHLSPQNGKKRVLEDRMGNWIQDVDNFQAPKPGKDLSLSIDLRIQNIVLKELEAAVKNLNAKSATLVMIDIRTGEILSMATAPSFNPNNTKERAGAALRNRALTDQLEPGSVIKTFSMLSALDSKQFTPETIINTHPGRMALGSNFVRDIRNYGELSLKNILQKSSNVGISKITLALPAEQLIQTFEKLGLGSEILTTFPGEQKGKLPPPPKNPFVHATLAFGYALAITPVQLAHAYATLASGGIKYPVSLIKLNPNDPEAIQGKRILSDDICQATLKMLTDVVATGTGRRAKIPGFSTAGKTGTTRVVGPHGYDEHRHIGLFAGITPAQNPRLATVIIIEEPNEKRYYGSLTAAPIYKKVLSQALIVLNIPPDPVPS